MNRRNTITALVVAVATAAVFTSSAAAMAKMDNGAVGTPSSTDLVTSGNAEIPYLSHGVGITREEASVSRSAEIPYLSHGVGITRPAPAEQATPIFRDQPDGLLPRGETVEVAATGSSVDWSEVATGFGFGLALAMLGALGVLVLRQRTTFRMQ